MKTLLLILRWPWLYIAPATALVMPWICYAVAGYIEADSRYQSPGRGLDWVRPSGDVLPLSAIITFIAVILIGVSVDQFKRRRPS